MSETVNNPLHFSNLSVILLRRSEGNIRIASDYNLLEALK